MKLNDIIQPEMAINNYQEQGLLAMKGGNETLSAEYYMKGLKIAQLNGDEVQSDEFRKLLLMLL